MDAPSKPLPSQFIFFLVPFQYRNSISASSIALLFTEEQVEEDEQDKGNLWVGNSESILKLFAKGCPLFNAVHLLTSIHSL